MTARSSWAGCLCGGCGIAIVLWAGAAAGVPHPTGFRPAVSIVQVTAEMTTSLAPLSHRLVTRAQHSIDRLLLLVGDVGIFWLRVALSIAAFLIVAAFASVVDTRMFTLQREPPGAVARYLGYGIRTFFLILLDRRTPYAARILLSVALLYWLVPFDLIADKSLVPGFIDDLAVAVVAAKGFVYLCPTSLVAAHARAVEERARRRRLPNPPEVAAPPQGARPHRP